MIFELNSVPILLAAIQAFLLGAFLYFNSKKQISRKFFALILISYAFHLFGYSVLLNPMNIRTWFTFCMSTYPLLFLIGPLHYIYAKSITEHDFKLSFKDSLHAIPFLIIAGIFYYTLATTGMFVSQILFDSIGIAFDLVTITYVYFAYLRLNTFENRYKEQRSNSSLVNFHSFKKLTLIYLIVCIIYAINTFFRVSGSTAIEEIDYLASLIFTALLFMMCYEVLQQKSLLDNDSDIQKLNRSFEPSLSEKEYDELKIKLHEQMQQNEFYLNENLKLNDLASSLEISSHLLSYLINKKVGCNFHEFVNSYRIEKAKDLLINSDYKILAVALESGFSNKSSFNRSFQRHVKMSPSSFRQKHQLEEKLT